MKPIEKASSRGVNDPALETTVVVCHLALERCRVYLSHLQAVMHLCVQRHEEDADHMAAQHAMTLVSNLERELVSGRDALETIL